MSGIILYADKIVDYFDIQMGHIPYYGSLDVFLWTIGNTVSPMLLIMGYFFNPYKWSLAAPGAAFSIQMTYIFRDVEWIGRDYFWLQSVVFFFTMILTVFVVDYLMKNIRDVLESKISLKDSFLEYLLELKEGPVRNLAKTAIKKDLYDEIYQNEVRANTKAIDLSIKNEAVRILKTDKTTTNA